MKAISLLSGGKDSFLATLIAMEQGFDVISAITVIPDEESMMFHVPNAMLAGYVGELIDIKTIFCKESEFEKLIAKLSMENGNMALVNGAIASNYQRNKLEAICTAYEMLCYSPLWRISQDLVMQEIIQRGIRPVIVAVGAEGLGEELLGRKIDEETVEKLKVLEKKYGLNITGEGGEYESFVSGYGSRTLEITKFKKNYSGSSGVLTIEELIKNF
ncbi:MAG: diphthine--ammonia ligase [Candidatus Thermoplasmatota archaeon]|nr:diphthine--ammonia ligase [Candidatus Thermoplasmatota archaeon]